MKKAVRGILVFAILMVGLLPVGASANSATFFDVDNDVCYTIELGEGTAKLGGWLEYKATISNQSESEVQIVSIYDNVCFWFDFWENQIDSFILEPGESISFIVQGTLSEGCDWYIENGKVYVDVKVYISFRTDKSGIEGWVDSINHYPEKLEITNIKDGSDLINLEILGNSTEMAFLDEGYNLDYKLNSSKTNINGFAILPVYMTNISGQVLEEVWIMNPLLNHSGESIEMSSGQSVFEVEYDYQQIDPTQTRPETSKAYAKVLIKKDGEYYGIQATTTCRNIFIDQKPEMEIEVERLPEALQTAEMGMDSYSITVKNVSKHPIQNFYIDMLEPGYYRSTDGSFDNTDIIYVFNINDEVTRTFTAPDEGEFDIKIGSVAFGEKISSLSYIYNADTKEGETWSSYPYMHFEYESDYIRATQYIVDSIGGDLPAQFEDYLTKIRLEELAEASASPSPSATPEAETVEPEPTPTAQIIYVTKNPAIPSWVWPVLGAVIVLAGGLVLWIRRKQNNEERGEKTDEKSI